MADLTVLIQQANEGNAEAANTLFALLYEDLRRIAHARLASAGRNTLLSTTSLVSEAYLRLAQTGQIKAANRVHYLAYASSAMRSVIVDFVRARAAERRGGGVRDVPLDTSIAENTPGGELEILRVHEALEELAIADERMVKVVEMRYFAGLSDPEVAEALGVTERTVRRYWVKARLLLAAALGS